MSRRGTICRSMTSSAAAAWRDLRNLVFLNFTASTTTIPLLTTTTTTTTTTFLIHTYSRQLSHLSFLFLSYFRFLVRLSFLSLGVLRFESRQVLAIYPTAMSSSKDPQSNIPASSKGSWSSFLKVSTLLHIRIGEPCAPGRKL